MKGLKTAICMMWIMLIMMIVIYSGSEAEEIVTTTKLDRDVRKLPPRDNQDSDYRIITEMWAVQIQEGINPDKLAEKFKAENLGQIGQLKGIYLFRVPNAYNRTKALGIEEQFKYDKRIKWFYQLEARRRYVKSVSFLDPLYPQQWHLSNTGQSGGTRGVDINVLPVWNQGITGQGIVIGIVDDGIQYSHPDLALNYKPSLSYDFYNKDSDPSPLSTEKHGTALAGIAAARDNSVCGVGVAYRSGIAGLRLISGQITDADEANALSYKRNEIHIYLNGWGGADDGKHLESPGQLTQTAIEDNIKNGRNGLGNIYVWSAGNGKKEYDNVNYDGYANSRYTIAVSSTDHNGYQSPYSEPGAAILVNGPSEGGGAGIICTDLMGQNGYDTGDCAEIFDGSSASSAVIAGVIALMLEANPNLTWRDVQHILVKSAVKNDPTDEDWEINAAGLNINHKYGFGRVNAETAVNLSKSWMNVPNEYTLSYDPVIVDRSIPDNNNVGISSEFYVEHTINLEHVEVVFNAIHTFRGDLRVILISPSGTESILAESHKDNHPDYPNWRFMTVRHWNESSKGKWKLTVIDPVTGDTGKFISWKLILYGTADQTAGNQPPFPKDDTVSTSLNVPVQINVLSNDFDINGDPLTITQVTLPNNGSATINANRTITYVPHNGYIGNDFFYYTVSDGLLSKQAKVMISVGETCVTFSSGNILLPIPDGGDVSGITSSIFVPIGGSIIDVNVSVNITHPYVSDLKGVLISPLGTKVTLFNHSGSSYSNFTDMILDDEATTAINDGKGPFTGFFRPVSPLSVLKGEEIAGEWKLYIIDEVREDTGRLNSWQLDICYMPLNENRPPIAQDDSAITQANKSVIIDILANDFDPNGDVLVISNVSPPGHGTAVVQNGKILYTPALDFTGEDTFSYTVSDSVYTDQGTVVIFVGQNQGIYFSQDTPVSIPDWDYRGVTSKISISGYGKVIDINLRINIDHPWSEDLKAYLVSPLGTRITLFENVSSVGNKFMSIVLDDEASLSISSGISPFILSYRPFSPLSLLNGEPVNGEWKLTIIDERGIDQGQLESWQLQVYYLPYSESQSPIPRDDYVETPMNTSITIPVLSNDYDLRIQALMITDVSNPNHGIVQKNADQTITYTPAPDFMGKDEFFYTISNSVKTAQAKVYVFVGRKIFKSLDTSVIIPDNYPGGLISTVMVPTFGMILDINVKLTISHSCPQDLKAYLISPLNEKITLFEKVGVRDKTDFIDTVLDDEAIISITAGLPPFTGSFKPVSSLSIFDGKEMAGEWKLLIIDTEAYDRGALVSWQIEAAYSAPSTYRPPVAKNDSVEIPYMNISRNPTSIIIPVTANDIAMNIDTLTVIDVSSPTQGITQIYDSKSISYQPNMCLSRQDIFTYTVSDDKGGISTAIVTINLNSNIITDSSFELGSPNPVWNQTSICWNNSPILAGGAHTGTWLVWFQNCDVKESASIEQRLIVPEATSAVLKFWFLMHHGEVPGFFRVKFDDQIVFSASEADATKYSKWSEIKIPVNSFADGQQHTLRMENGFKSDENQKGLTSFLIDDVSLHMIKCPQEPFGLKEVISVLKISAGIPTGFYGVIDINSDGKIGLPEAINILQIVAGF